MIGIVPANYPKGHVTLSGDMQQVTPGLTGPTGSKGHYVIWLRALRFKLRKFHHQTKYFKWQQLAANGAILHHIFYCTCLVIRK